MNHLFVCCLLIVTVLQLQSQPKSLYGIAGQQRFNTTFRINNVDLFKVAQNKLSKIQSLLQKGEWAIQVGVYPQLQKAIVFKEWDKYDRDSFTIETKYKTVNIDFSRKLKIDSTLVFYWSDTIPSFGTRTLVSKERFQIVTPREGTYMITPYYVRDTIQPYYGGFLGFGLQGQPDTVFNASILSHLHTEGEQGIGNNKFQMSQMMGIGGGLRKDSIYNYLKLSDEFYFIKDTVLINIPDKQGLIGLYPKFKIPTSKTGIRDISVYNCQNIILPCGFEYNNGIPDRSHLAIYDLKNKIWMLTPWIKGFNTYQSIRSFSDWISGYEAYDLTFTIFNKVEKFKQPMPGKEFRPTGGSKYGPCFDQQAEFFKAYMTGMLFIYNITTGKYIEWQALENGKLQADSEVLLIENNTVYYRINDKLYQANVVKDTKLSKPKLLAQDPAVRDIHWLFFAQE